MSFFEKSLTTLELPAVLTMLAAEAVGDTAKERALALTPSTDEAEVRHRIEETTAAKTMMVVRGSPSFYGVKDVRASLARADLGGALNTRELLDIAGDRRLRSPEARVVQLCEQLLLRLHAVVVDELQNFFLAF